MDQLRRSIRNQVHRLVGTGSRVRTARDEGLFGQDAACRQVHSDFTTMMIGGIAALLMQMLHPKVLAGVWDHSNFRHDMAGRLRRTAQFISVTTYGSTDDAMRMIERVRLIHDHVHGRLPDGTPYNANDPDLLAWVHVAEVSSFLSAYLRYRDPFFSRAQQDRYFEETAQIARLLGAESVPRTRRQVSAYLQASRANLRVDHRTREVARILLSHPPLNLALAPFQRLVTEAALDLLPDWAVEMHGLRLPVVRKPAMRVGVVGLGAVLRWALR